MKYAIIAAGEGSRLSHEGLAVPKPLLKVHGECLVDRLIRIFMANDAELITVVCNDRTPLVAEHLQHMAQVGLAGRAVPLHVVVKSTPSSMHSFYELRQHMDDAPFCLTTVDTIFSEAVFARYLHTFGSTLQEGSDGLMGVSDYIDDEKPLYVAVDEAMAITGFYDEQRDCSLVSGGIYGLTGQSFAVLDACMAAGESRMRNFQRALLREGMRLKAFNFGKVLDVDHASDLLKAEAFLRDDASIE